LADDGLVFIFEIVQLPVVMFFTSKTGIPFIATADDIFIILAKTTELGVILVFSNVKVLAEPDAIVVF
jgi:hypothetical protein